MSRRFSRAERLTQIRVLQAAGLTRREIAARLAMTPSGVRNIINDPDGSKQRARRATYTGTCADCGTPTRSNGTSKPSPRCPECAARANAEAALKWTPELILARIQEWAGLYGEPPAIPDWQPTTCYDVYHDWARARRFVEANGHWPWSNTVIQRFGSWNAAISAAGFEPRAAIGTTENRRRHRRARAAA